jgi:alpha-1,3-rhamnosyl/mannosyltransferase
VTFLLDARTGRRPTGIANYTFALAREFGALAPHEVRPICHRRHRRTMERMGLRPYAAAAGDLPVARLPDATVAHGPNYRPVEHVSAGQVVTIHDLGFLTLPECHPPGMPERLDAIMQSSVDRVDMFVCVSSDTRDALLDAYGVEPGRCAVVHNGVDTTLFRPASRTRRPRTLRWRYRMERPYVLFVGAMVPRKDLVTLLEAFRRIATEHPDVELVVAGNKTRRWASDWPRVKAWLARHRDVRRRVRILDYVPARDLPALYGHSAAVALTSLLEGFGMTVLEGLACGRPVVATRAGAVPEVGQDAIYYGEVRDPDSIAAAIDAALADEDGDRRRRRAAEIVAEHSWRRTAERTLDVYRLVAGRHGAVAGR